MWVHGDVAINNVLVDHRGAFSAMIDFGCSAGGDPACDTVNTAPGQAAFARRVLNEVLEPDQ